MQYFFSIVWDLNPIQIDEYCMESQSFTHTIGNGIEILSINEASFGSEGTALARTIFI